MRLTQIFDRFNDLQVMVVGDVMIDAYYFGKVDRISPEAPVPIVTVNKKDRRLGGAGNVALNLQSLGAKAVPLAVRGDDLDGELLAELFETENISTKGIIIDSGRQTTVKTRIIGNSHHVLRVDNEDTSLISLEVENQLLERAQELIKSTQALIFEDYNKGLLSATLIEKLIKLAEAHNVPVIVDPKKENFFAYKNVKLFKPNRREVQEGLKWEGDLTDKAELKRAIQSLITQLNCDYVMATLSEAGVVIASKTEWHEVAAHKRKIIDVSGAGDSVVAVTAVAMAAGLDARIVAELANLAGGLVCESLGVVPIDKEQLLSEAIANKLDPGGIS